jgi:hypothetical protein
MNPIGSPMLNDGEGDNFDHMSTPERRQPLEDTVDQGALAMSRVDQVVQPITNDTHLTMAPRCERSTTLPLKILVQ